jgi:hypothetical protein
LVDLITLLNDISGTLRSCPEVSDELDGNVSTVLPYEDVTTATTNSLARAIYTMPNGSVLVAWLTTDIVEGELQSAWEHRVEIYVRAVKLKSPLKLVNAIIDGKPEGQDLPWRYLCVNDDVLPVEISEVARIVDEEGIDYYVMRCAFKEKGD